MLGFLSVSTTDVSALQEMTERFQSRAGFSECLDGRTMNLVSTIGGEFQSRAGFSECLDTRTTSTRSPRE